MAVHVTGDTNTASHTFIRSDKFSFENPPRPHTANRWQQVNWNTRNLAKSNCILSKNNKYPILKNLFFISFAFLLFLSCENESDNKLNKEFINLSDTTEIFYKDCLLYPDNKSIVCLDSILNDSRCPIGLVCIWEGAAYARFKFIENDSLISFVDLRLGTIDTVLLGFKFSFTDLLPYPTYGSQIDPNNYKARILIKN